MTKKREGERGEREREKERGKRESEREREREKREKYFSFNVLFFNKTSKSSASQNSKTVQKLLNKNLSFGERKLKDGA